MYGQRRLLFSVGDLNVRVSSETNDEINHLLSSTVVGSEGGMQYTMRNIAARIANYGDNIRFISVYLKTSLVAVIGTCYRDCRLGDQTYPVHTFGFSHFARSTRQKGSGRDCGEEQAGNDKEDSFRNQTLRYLESHICLNMRVLRREVDICCIVLLRGKTNDLRI